MRLHPIILSFLASAGITAGGELSQSAEMKYIGIAMGLLTVCLLILRILAGWAVRKIIEQWDAIPGQITGLEKKVEGLAFDVRSLTSALNTHTQVDEERQLSLREWRADMHARIGALEQRVFGSVRARDAEEERG